VGEKPPVPAKKRQPVLADAPAGFLILVADRLGLILERRFRLRRCRAGTGERTQARFHPVERPEKVDGRRPGGGEAGFGLEEFRENPGVAGSTGIPYGEVSAVSRRYADRRGSPHPELIDGFPYLGLSPEAEEDNLVGQEGLVENHERAFAVVEPHGFDGLSYHGFPLRLSLCFSWPARLRPSSDR
jgi:hypothetical protein